MRHVARELNVPPSVMSRFWKRFGIVEDLAKVENKKQLLRVKDSLEVLLFDVESVLQEIC